MGVYKDTERNTWFVSVSYKDINQKRQRKVKRGFATQREAKQWERDFLAMCEQKPTLSFNALYKHFINDAKTRLKASTLYSHTKHIKKNILPFFKDFVVADITPAHIRQWQNELIEKHFADSTLKIYSSLLSSIFNFAVKYHGLKDNPCKIVGSIGKLKRPKESIKFWTLDEYNEAIKTLERNTLDHTIISLLYSTGCRIGELLALTISDFNQTEKYISITKTLDEATPKTEASKRRIYLSDDACKILQSHIGQMTIDDVYTPKPTTPLFNTTASTVREHLHKLCVSAGVTDIRVHDLRHSHASLLINLGVPPLVICERLGHENINVTLSIYSHLYPNKQEDAIQKLNKCGI